MGKNKNRGASKKAQKAKNAVPPKALPVTLLSGFLGSGKTSLLQHILKTNHGLRIAVVVNDIGAINVDASLIKNTHTVKQTSEKVIALQNGCICCTLRGDLLEELVRIARLQAFDYVVIESSGISEPEQVAETFDARLAEQMDAMGSLEDGGLDEDMLRVLKQLKEAGGLEKFARLDTTVTVIDAFTMLHDFDTDELLSYRRDDVTPEDERTVSDLMVDQIEFADVVILNKIDTVEPEQRTRLTAMIKQLNHRARLIEANYGKIDVSQIVNTGMFDLSKAQLGPGWLQDLHEMTVREVNGKNVVTPKPETEEYNVRSFIYRRCRPFHPRRLWALLYDKFILQMEAEDEDEDDEDEDMEDQDEDEDADVETDDDKDNTSVASIREKRSLPASPQSSHSTVQTVPSDTGSPSKKARILSSEDQASDQAPDQDMIPPSNAQILTTKRAHPILARLFRSKGEFHLATRPHRAGEWSQAGAMLTLKGGREWFCTLDESQYLPEDPEVAKMVKHDIALGGEWGDRRQEIVFIGERLEHVALETLLDACLLTDGEFKDWEGVMRDEGLDEEGRMERLGELFEDGFPDWHGDGEDDDEEGHEGHDHSHGKSLRSIKEHTLEEVS